MKTVPLFVVVLTFVSLIMVSCVTPPVVPPERDSEFSSAVTDVLSKDLTLDPYANTVYFNDDSVTAKINKAYEDHIVMINTGLTPSQLNMRGYMSYGNTQSGINPKSYMDNKANWIDLIKQVYKVNTILAENIYNDLYHNGWSLYMNGHAVENGDLAQYDVPIRFVYIRQWVAGGGAYKNEWRDFSYTLRAKTGKSSTPVPATNSNKDDISARLKKLDDLHSKGLITEDEYQTKRKKLLDEL